MVGKLWDKIWKKLVNRETVAYFIFGVLTTLVDWFSYRVMRQCGIDYRVATVGSWGAAVLFAFITNKLFVFCSMDLHPRKIWQEFVPFVTGRIATGLFVLIAMMVMVDGLGIRQDFICKIVLSAVSLVLNYVISKWFVFKRTL